jgi:quercetin dioxygenase-like cupin family protein
MRVLAPLTLLAGALTIVAAVQGPSNSSNKPKDPWTWGPAPAVFSAGARMAVLQGDPSQAAPFTVRLEMPDGYKIAPHFHPTDEHITVIEGTFLVGMGDKLDAAQTMVLPRGGFATAQANQHHFAIARGRTIVQVHAIGPFQLTYVNPADDPQNKLKASAGGRP